MRVLSIAVFLTFSSFSLRSTEAEEYSLPHSMATASQQALIMLAASDSVSYGYYVDSSADQLTVRCAGTADTQLLLKVERPDGVVVNAVNVDQHGGDYHHIDGLALPGISSEFLLLGRDTQVITIPTPTPGEYTVIAERTEGATGDLAVLLHVSCDSTMAVYLHVSDTSIALGGKSTLSMFAAVGDQTVEDATHGLQLIAPDGSVVQLLPHDDGLGADVESGDGVYSIYFEPSQLGHHSLLLQTTFADGGNTVYRNASGHIQVLPQRAVLLCPPAVSWLDDDGDGLFEQLLVDFSVVSDDPCQADLLTRLRTPGGTTFSLVASSQLPAGLGILRTSFDLRGLSESGPFTILGADLLLADDDAGFLLADRCDEAIHTDPVHFSMFDIPRLRLTHDDSTQLDDADQDGDYDEMRFLIGIEAEAAGRYEFGAVVSAPCGQTYIANGEADLVASPLTDHLTVRVPGAVVGTWGLSGPYRVVYLEVWNDAAFLAEKDPSTAFVNVSPSEFEGFTTVPDCNANSIHDLCDIFVEVSNDCDENDIPDECDIAAGAADCDDNGVQDECELFLLEAIDCNANGTPDNCEIAGGAADCWIAPDEILDECQCIWDYDGSGSVDPYDANGIMAQFGCTVGQGDVNCDRADLDCNGQVNPFDSSAVYAHMGPCP